MLRYINVLFILVCAGLSACSINPVTGERQFSLVSASEEVTLGEQNYVPYQQSQGGQYIVDPNLSAYVSKVGRKLAAVSDRKDLPYEFVVLNNDVPNAWALPGGKIAINRGLLLLLDDEAQLAAVMGHEIVHAAARHGATQQTQQKLLGLGTGIVGLVSNSQLANYGAQLGAGAWQARYGRSQELESDEYGMLYMERAGYEPQAAVELQELFVKLSEGHNSDFLTNLMASHPPSQERVDKNLARAKTMNKGLRNRAAFQRAIAQIKKDKGAYDANAKALEAYSKKDYSSALSYANQAIKLQDEEALFYVTRGQILTAQKQMSAAESAFSVATKKYPEYFMGFLGLGLTQKSEGKLSTARTSLTKSLKLLPTQSAVYHLGEVELASGNQQQAIQYFQAAQSQGGDLGQAAESQLAKLGVSSQAQP